MSSSQLLVKHKNLTKSMTINAQSNSNPNFKFKFEVDGLLLNLGFGLKPQNSAWGRKRKMRKGE